MTINGVEISEYGAEQWNVVREYQSINNASEWVTGAIEPIMLGSAYGMKKIKVSVILRGQDRQEIWRNGGRLISALLRPCAVKLDGFENNYMVMLKNVTQAETSIRRWHKATLELQGYEFGDEVTKTFNNVKKIEIINQGSLETPCNIEITPGIGKTYLSITGMTRNSRTAEEKAIKITGLTKDKTIRIDSDTGLITEEEINKFPDVDIWALPSLLPGKNTITLDQVDIKATITFKPRYM